MPEYFIKNDPQSEAQGPLTLDQLKTMAEGGQLTPQSLHFYDDLVGWQPVQMNFALMQALFPNKPKLSLKKTPSVKAKASHKDPTGPTVEDMLQSAQGKTDARRAQSVKTQWQERVAALSLPVLTLLTLAMGGLLMFANWAAAGQLYKGDWMALVMHPGLPLSIAFLILGLLLVLTVVAVYPAVRYLALVVMGFFALHAWGVLAQDFSEGWLLLMSGVAYGLGILILTLTLNFVIFLLSTLLSVAGLVAYGYFIFLGL